MRLTNTARSTVLCTSMATLLTALLGAPLALADDVIKPAEMSKADLAGKLFEHPDTSKTERDNGTVLDVTSLLSSDKKFASGMYQAPASRWEITEPYGVDEFMYFLEGGVTLTSSDGSVQTIEAGEAVTIPKEWTGVWETEGYTKIWVIYSEDGSAFE
ncbi:cupin domain-containing protein [Parahaliea mediterranea]|uniref:cupin domain-containing protein n=1 Tax=Parahaliea mediterranea TaxID=651086 RepID=UPI001F4EA13D|nr:cupin domain-containing protein [Parahaliea mediterranea]